MNKKGLTRERSAKRRDGSASSAPKKEAMVKALTQIPRVTMRTIAYGTRSSDTPCMTNISQMMRSSITAESSGGSDTTKSMRTPRTLTIALLIGIATRSTMKTTGRPITDQLA